MKKKPKRRLRWLVVWLHEQRQSLLQASDQKYVFERWEQPNGARMARVLALRLYANNMATAPRHRLHDWTVPAKQIDLKTGDEINNPKWGLEHDVFFKTGEWPFLDKARKAWLQKQKPNRSIILRKQIATLKQRLAAWQRKEKLARTYQRKIRQAVRRKEHRLADIQLNPNAPLDTAASRLANLTSGN